MRQAFVPTQTAALGLLGIQPSQKTRTASKETRSKCTRCPRTEHATNLVIYLLRGVPDAHRLLEPVADPIELLRLRPVVKRPGDDDLSRGLVPAETRRISGSIWPESFASGRGERAVPSKLVLAHGGRMAGPPGSSDASGQRLGPVASEVAGGSALMDRGLGYATRSRGGGGGEGARGSVGVDIFAGRRMYIEGLGVIRIYGIEDQTPGCRRNVSRETKLMG